jgi:hypothetical protein
MRFATVTVLAIGCSAPKASPSARVAEVPIDARIDAPIDASIDAAPPSCVDDGDPFAPATIHARVAALADPALDGRAPGTAGDRTARAIVVDRFACLGLAPAFPGYTQPFDDTANVVGYLPGETPEIIVVGAHLDHLGDHHLGANDDASGVAGMLAIAQAIAARRVKPHRTIVFAAFGAEELGMHGSTYFVAHMPAALPIANVVYDVNLDMIGTHASQREVIALGDFPRQPARAILDRLTAHTRLNVVPGGRGVGSDHEPFCTLGIPYIFFWTPDARCYHATCDTIANLDDVHTAPIAALAADLVSELATASFTSQRTIGCDGRTLHAR